jgi:hypothetical protein
MRKLHSIPLLMLIITVAALVANAKMPPPPIA